MIVVLKKNATEKQIQHIKQRAIDLGFKIHESKGVEVTILGLIGDERKLNKQQIEAMEGVEKVMEVLKPYRLASRDFHPHDTIIDVNGVKIGGKELIIMAGPCAVESEAQICGIAKEVKKLGAQILRGGAFKPRSSPYAFQGLEGEGLKHLAKAREQTGLPIITEVLDTHEVPLVAEYADILQIGTRNMQNFKLLKAVGKQKKPVLLKRGMSATLEEFLMAAEYIMSEGNHNVILCERGIRTFNTYTRNTLDLAIVPVLKKLTHLPIVVDPSHGTGKYDLVIPMSRAAVAAGCDGLIIECHTEPEKSVSDADQTISPKRLAELIKEIKPIAAAVGKFMK
ncbi:TPA: 3-deoxy-7-phosphoheptulonate synthase [Candidatus Woesearchaeota archaeon]|nr:3-deoxy-7-phosphoheptulonate synthase [Candidatus Woesearchaeota archaeon]